MVLNIRAYHPLDHPPITFPEKYAKEEATMNGPDNTCYHQRAKFLQDWQQKLDKQLDKRKKKDEEDRLLRELDAY